MSCLRALPPLVVIVTLIAMLAGPAPLLATVHYVAQSGGDFTTIKTAVNAAADGDTVLVAAGTYSGPSNTDIDPAGRNIVIVSESGPDATVIDCSGGAPYRRGVYYHSGEDTTSVVDGFHFTSGVSVMGGGINCTGASPLIRNCVFTGCGVAYGGALYLNQSQAVVRDCSFLRNDVFVSGGAIWIENSTPVIASCVIDSCSAGFIAGGILIHEGGSTTVRDVTISNCGSGGEGAGVYCQDAPSYFFGVEFIANTADSTDGGGLYANCDVTLEDCLFQDNYAGGDGAGLYCIGATPSLADCDFVSNWSDAAGGGICADDAQLSITGGDLRSNFAAMGGGVFVSGAVLPQITGAGFAENEAVIMGGGIYGELLSLPFFTDCVFEDNTAVFGGAMALDASSGGAIESCVFTGNSAESGAALDIASGSDTAITSCTLSGNAAVPGDGAIASTDSSPGIDHTIMAGTESGAAIVCHGSPTPSTTRSCVFGNAAGDSLCGDHSDNLFSDPLFCDAGGGDLGLHDDSPCLPGNNAWSELVGALVAGGCGPSTGVDEPIEQLGLALRPAHPNPFTSATTVRYHLPAGVGGATLDVYDVAGRLVRNLETRAVEGDHAVVWDGLDARGAALPSGVYFVRIRTPRETRESTVVLVR